MGKRDADARHRGADLAHERYGEPGQDRDQQYLQEVADCERGPVDNARPKSGTQYVTVSLTVMVHDGGNTPKGRNE